MTMTLEQDESTDALKDFNEGFDDGWYNRPRQKNRGAQYIRTYRRATELRRQEDEGGVDVAAARRRK